MSIYNVQSVVCRSVGDDLAAQRPSELQSDGRSVGRMVGLLKSMPNVHLSLSVCVPSLQCLVQTHPKGLIIGYCFGLCYNIDSFKCPIYMYM